MSAAAAALMKCATADDEISDDAGYWHMVAMEQADYELDDVLDFLRRHERDQVLGITPPPLADLIDALRRGEHRR